MMNTRKRVVSIATVVTTVLGAFALGGGASHAQMGNQYNCVNTPGGALCTSAGVPSAYPALPNAYAAAPYAPAASAYAAVPDTFNSQSRTVFLPGAVAHNGRVIGRDPDPNVRLDLMRNPNPLDLNGG